MGKSPVPLWSYTDAAYLNPFRARRPLEGHWYDGFAQVEANLARLGIPVSAYVESEIREVAAMLGANTADEDSGPVPLDQMPVGDPNQFRMT